MVIVSGESPRRCLSGEADNRMHRNVKGKRLFTYILVFLCACPVKSEVISPGFFAVNLTSFLLLTYILVYLSFLSDFPCLSVVKFLLYCKTKTLFYNYYQSAALTKHF